MAKRIKLTEAQIEMLQKLESATPRKVLRITEDQYNRLFNPITENEKLTGHPVAGDGGDEYNPQTEKENEDTYKAFNEGIVEGISEDVSTIVSIAEFVGEFKELIKHILTNPSQEGLSPFWLKLGVTWGDLISVMSSMGLIFVSGVAGQESIQLVKKSEFLKKLKIGGMKRLYNIFVNRRYDMRNGGKIIQQDETISLGNDIELTEVGGDGGYPAGAEHDGWAPWNREDGESEDEQPIEYRKAAKKPLKLVWFNLDADGLAIFSYKGKLIAHLGGWTDATEMEDYCDIHAIDGECTENYINDLVINKKVKIGNYNPEFYKTNKLTLIDDNVKQALLQNFGEAEGLADILNGGQGIPTPQAEGEIEETTSTGSVGGSYVTPKIWAKSPASMRFANKPMYKQGKIVEDEPAAPETDAAKRGRKPLNDSDKKMEMIIKTLYKTYPELKNSRTNLRFVIGDIFSKLALGINESSRPGQIEFDDCTQLNNNKEAQNGGCSVGAVDNVVTVKEDIFTEVAQRTGRSISEVKAIIEANFTK